MNPSTAAMASRVSRNIRLFSSDDVASHIDKLVSKFDECDFPYVDAQNIIELDSLKFFISMTTMAQEFSMTKRLAGSTFADHIVSNFSAKYSKKTIIARSCYAFYHSWKRFAQSSTDAALFAFTLFDDESPQRLTRFYLKARKLLQATATSNSFRAPHPSIDNIEFTLEQSIHILKCLFEESGANSSLNNLNGQQSQPSNQANQRGIGNNNTAISDAICSNFTKFLQSNKGVYAPKEKIKSGILLEFSLNQYVQVAWPNALHRDEELTQNRNNIQSRLQYPQILAKQSHESNQYSDAVENSEFSLYVHSVSPQKKARTNYQQSSQQSRPNSSKSYNNSEQQQQPPQKSANNTGITPNNGYRFIHQNGGMNVGDQALAATIKSNENRLQLSKSSSTLSIQQQQQQQQQNAAKKQEFEFIQAIAREYPRTKSSGGNTRSTSATSSFIKDPSAKTTTTTTTQAFGGVFAAADEDEIVYSKQESPPKRNTSSFKQRQQGKQNRTYNENSDSSKKAAALIRSSSGKASTVRATSAARAESNSRIEYDDVNAAVDYDDEIELLRLTKNNSSSNFAHVRQLGLLKLSDNQLVTKNYELGSEVKNLRAENVRLAKVIDAIARSSQQFEQLFLDLMQLAVQSDENADEVSDLLRRYELIKQFDELPAGNIASISPKKNMHSGAFGSPEMNPNRAGTDLSDEGTEFADFTMYYHPQQYQQKAQFEKIYNAQTPQSENSLSTSSMIPLSHSISSASLSQSNNNAATKLDNRLVQQNSKESQQNQANYRMSAMNNTSWQQQLRQEVQVVEALMNVSKQQKSVLSSQQQPSLMQQSSEKSLEQSQGQQPFYQSFSQQQLLGKSNIPMQSSSSSSLVTNSTNLVTPVRNNSPLISSQQQQQQQQYQQSQNNNMSSDQPLRQVQPQGLQPIQLIQIPASFQKPSSMQYQKEQISNMQQQQQQTIENELSFRPTIISDTKYLQQSDSLSNLENTSYAFNFNKMNPQTVGSVSQFPSAIEQGNQSKGVANQQLGGNQSQRAGLPLTNNARPTGYPTKASIDTIKTFQGNEEENSIQSLRFDQAVKEQRPPLNRIETFDADKHLFASGESQQYKSGERSRSQNAIKGGKQIKVHQPVYNLRGEPSSQSNFPSNSSSLNLNDYSKWTRLGHNSNSNLNKHNQQQSHRQYGYQIGESKKEEIE